MQCWIYMFIYK